MIQSEGKLENSKLMNLDVLMNFDPNFSDTYLEVNFFRIVNWNWPELKAGDMTIGNIVLIEN